MSLEEILTKRATLSYYSWLLPETLHLKSNYYSLYIGFCLVILLENILLTSNRNHRIILMLPFCFLFLFLGLLSSRMSFLAVAIFLTVWLCKFVFERKFRAKSLLIIGSTVVFLIILTLQFPFLHSKISGILEQGTQSDPRYMLFQCGWQIFTDNFFFGAGISDVEELAIICYESVNNTIAIDEQYNFHNVFLQWAASTGMAGLLVFTILLVLLFVRAIKMNKMVPLGFIFLFFMASLTESLLTRNKGLIFFTTFSTLFFIRQSNEEDTSH